VRDFDENGYSIFESVLGPSEREGLISSLAAVPRSRAGARHILANPLIAALAGDDRLREIARGILGEGAAPYRATLFDKSAGANWLVVWHQDTALPFRSRFAAEGWGPWSVKEGVNYAHAPASALGRIVALRIHLDASGPHNGPLRVIPGSHRLGILTDDAIAAMVERVPAFECLVPAGGVLAMRPLLLHSSTKSTRPTSRRVIHIEYADAPSFGPGRELAAA
jgi:ectoine hydroxylase-related dioxygenase (phytanoyl-CoA dioxygenase family)